MGRNAGKAQGSAKLVISLVRTRARSVVPARNTLSISLCLQKVMSHIFITFLDFSVGYGGSKTMPPNVLDIPCEVLPTEGGGQF